MENRKELKGGERAKEDFKNNESFNKIKEGEMAKKKNSIFRYEWGNLDLISAGLFFVGLVLTQISNLSTIGLILMAIGVLKQISGK